MSISDGTVSLKKDSNCIGTNIKKITGFMKQNQSSCRTLALYNLNYVLDYSTIFQQNFNVLLYFYLSSDPKQADWATEMIQLLKEFQDYVKDRHAVGMQWNTEVSAWKIIELRKWCLSYQLLCLVILWIFVIITDITITFLWLKLQLVSDRTC